LPISLRRKNIIIEKGGKMKVIYYILLAILLFGCAINTNKSINEKNVYDSLVNFLETTKKDSLKYEYCKNEIITRFPSSEKTYELANEEFYDKVYPIWRNDSSKVEVISKLIRKYPQTSWRRTMYQYLTYSLDNLGRIEELKEILQEFREAFPQDYKPFSQSARYMNRNDIEPKQALEFARQAHTMSFNYPKLDYFPPMEWKLEERSAPVKTAALLADILIKQDNYEEAEKILTAVIKNNKLGIDDETTLGACYYFLAKAYEGMNRKKEAVQTAVQSLIAGDSRNYYTPLADSLLRKIIGYKDLSEDEYIDFVRTQAGYKDVIFSDVTEEYGLENVGAGRIAWGDYDNDGFVDMLLNGSRLFKNEKGKRFIDVTQEAFTDTIRGNGGLWGDFDNDGDLDIVTKDPESIWLNKNGIFTRVSGNNAIENNEVTTEGIGIGDVNNDGFLDIYFANYEVWKQTHSEPEEDSFFKGIGDGKFYDITDRADLLPKDGKKRAGRGVSNYRLQDNFLWVNDGTGHFENRALELCVAGDEVEGWWGHTIGSEWIDVDNDGDFDLITCNLAHPRYIDFSNKTRLYINENGKFVDRRKEAGIKFEETHSEPCWADFNNDGFLDLYINCVYEGRRSFLYMNNGDNTFREVSFLAGVRHFNGWGAACADFDNDGDMDFLAAGGKIQLFRNDTPKLKKWLEVKIIGKDHSDGIGTHLTLSNENVSLIREIQGGKGTTNQHSLIQHFGLGEYELPFELKIRFPDGEERKLEIKEINNRIRIIE
jgi:tetratricopeptide (TPR) repeat protein